MANSPNVHKRKITMRINEDEYRKAEKKFGNIGPDGLVHDYLPIIRAVEDACRDVGLTVEDFEIILERVRGRAHAMGKEVK